jgi:hypothetical protein
LEGFVDEKDESAGEEGHLAGFIILVETKEL